MCARIFACSVVHLRGDELDVARSLCERRSALHSQIGNAFFATIVATL